MSDDATKLPESFGATIGPYEIVRVLRRGQSATIYLAVTPGSRREVAIKVGAGTIHHLLDAGSSEKGSVSRCLVHRHIVRVLDAGNDAGLSYVVMERLRGRSLREWIDNPPTRPDLATKIDLVAQLCVGLHFAHEHGVVHGNVTPENVFVTDENVVKILNLGVGPVDRTVISHAAGSGGGHYSAPEQLGGREVDARSDLFAVGLILYEFVMGHPPSEHTGAAIAVAPVRREDSAPIEDLAKLEILVRRALDDDPAKRFASAQQLAYALWKTQLPSPNADTDAEEIEGPAETVYVDRGTDGAEATIIEAVVEQSKEQPKVSTKPLIYASLVAVIMVAVAIASFSC